MVRFETQTRYSKNCFKVLKAITATLMSYFFRQRTMKIQDKNMSRTKRIECQPSREVILFHSYGLVNQVIHVSVFLQAEKGFLFNHVLCCIVYRLRQNNSRNRIGFSWDSFKAIYILGYVQRIQTVNCNVILKQICIFLIEITGRNRNCNF